MPSLPGDRGAPPRRRPHRARCAWRGHRAEAQCLPYDRLASAAARGSWTGGASGSLAFAWTVVTLGIPLAFTVAPPGGAGDLCRSPVPRPRVLLMPDEPGSRRARRRRRRSDQTCGSLRGSCHAELALRCPRRFPAKPPLWLAVRSSRSSFQRSPLHCLASRGVHVPRARRRDRFGDRSPTRLVRRLRGLAPPWRFAPPRPCPGIAPGFQSWGS